MKTKKKLILYFILMIFSASLKAQPISSNYDWDNFPCWENTTVYSKTYFVDQKHPDASDSNPGTIDKPLQTINKAAQLVKAGEKVIIYSGVYRETIEPLNGGIGADKMISYESAPGGQVIIKGSKIINTEWIQRRVLTDVLPDTSLTYTWSRKIWVTTLPDEFFENGYYPLKLQNILPSEYVMMPWANLVKKLAPYNSTRGLIFQNGKRMIQLEDYNDLARVDGAFWIDNDGKTIHIHAFGGGNPNNELFEIGVQQHLFVPQKIGLGYIQLQGLIFEHCANGFLRTSTGAVTALGGHHWIFQDNTIRNINSSGLEFGYYAFEFTDPNPRNIQPRTDEDLGGVIVRNNQIYDCGTAGIRSYSVKNGIIENNHIWNCGWQDAENYWECSGIKLLRTNHTLVKGNHIHNIQGGNGIWLDWDIQYSRVTANIIHDVQNIQGGIFIEASQTPNLVDNNFIWNIDGNGTSAEEMEFWYPGDKYVDWCGYSYFSDPDQEMIKFARKHNKPVFIAEATPTLTDENGKYIDCDLSNPELANMLWDNWFEGFFKTIEENGDVVKAFSYINCDWRPQAMWIDNPTFQKVNARIQDSKYLSEKWKKKMEEDRYLEAKDMQ